MIELTERLRLGALELEHKFGIDADSTVFGQALTALEAQEAKIAELVEALEALTYESGGYYYVGMHGDSDVTEIVSTALSKALTPSLPK